LLQDHQHNQLNSSKQKKQSVSPESEQRQGGGKDKRNMAYKAVHCRVLRFTTASDTFPKNIRDYL